MNSILRRSLLCFVLVFSVTKTFAQTCSFSYPFNTIVENEISTYTPTWQHAPVLNEFNSPEYRFHVTAGTTYEWSLCTEDGANNDNGGFMNEPFRLAFSDSVQDGYNDLSTHQICIDNREKLTWVAVFTGTVYIQSKDDFCLPYPSDLMYRAYNCNEITNVAITSSSNTVCQGATVDFSLPTLPVGSAIQWLMNGVEIPFATTNTYYTNQANVLYSATVSLPGTTCAAHNTNTILLQDFSADIRSTSSAGVSINPVICGGSPIILDAYEGNAISYEWKYNGIAIVNANTSSYNVTQPGEYTVSIGFQGCTANDTVQVTSGQTPSTPLIIPAGIPTFCQGGSVLLDGSSLTGYTYQWYLNGASIPLATYNTFYADSSGEYALTIVNGEGCQASSNSIVVTVNDCAGFESIHENQIRIYPNPTEHIISIETANQLQIKAIEILDIQGKLMRVLALENTHSEVYTFPLNELQNGLYLIKLSTLSGTVVKRFSIAHN